MTKNRAAKTTKRAGRRVPSLRVHKQSQRCYGTFSGQQVWFGLRNDPGTQERFDAYLAECKQGDPKCDHLDQLRHYMARLQEETNIKPRGILVHGGAQKLRSEISKAARRTPRVELVRYRVTVDFDSSV